MPPIPDWQLPPGVDRGLWDYLQSRELAQQYDESLADTPLLQVDQQFCHTQFPTPGRLIDLGCGSGRLLLDLAARGYECVGVDLSTEMLAVARHKLDAAGLQAELIAANLVELDGIAAQSFDYAACLFSTLGMIRGAVLRRQFLQHVARILKPGGRFVVHVHNRWYYGGAPGLRGQVHRDWWRTLWRRSDAGDRTAPVARAGAELTLHHFTRGEIVRDLTAIGFRIAVIQPMAVDRLLADHGIARSARTYGYLIASTI